MLPNLSIPKYTIKRYGMELAQPTFLVLVGKLQQYCQATLLFKAKTMPKLDLSERDIERVIEALGAHATLLETVALVNPNNKLSLLSSANENKALAQDIKQQACLPRKAFTLTPMDLEINPSIRQWQVGDRVRVADTRLTHYGKAGTVVGVEPGLDRPVIVDVEGIIPGGHWCYYTHIELEAEHNP
jgi:hypothetical protein